MDVLRSREPACHRRLKSWVARRLLSISWALLAIGLAGADGGAAAGTSQAAAGTSEGEGRPFVCAEIVIAIDASDSTRRGGFRRQTTALDVALRHADLHRAIQDCLPGSIALSMFTWSGPIEQHGCLPWKLILDGRGSALSAFALSSCRYIGGTTDIGAALEHGLDLFARSPFDSHYRTILLLTNGRTDRGAEMRLQAARSRAARLDVSLVGHALVRRAGSWTSGNPDGQDRFVDYVAKQVTIGPRSFTGSSTIATDIPAIIDTLIGMLRQELL